MNDVANMYAQAQSYDRVIGNRLLDGHCTIDGVNNTAKLH
jgi:hypothetical protein